MPRRRRRRRQSWLRRNGIYLAVLILVMIPVFGVVAKYIYQNQDKGLFAAKEFYFTSNLLSEDAPEYKINSNATEVSFTLGNNADGLRFADDEITYSVTVEPALEMTGADNKLENGQISTDTVTLKGLEKGVTYTVTATGKAGYKKTISASFTVGDNGENVYHYLDASNREYVLYTVWAENVKGALSANFPTGLIPDNTDLELRDIRNYENDTYVGKTFTDEESFTGNYSSRTYRFFVDAAAGKKAADFKVDDFTAVITDSEVNHAAAAGTPK